ncbi:unnamed protein product [Arctia plantaginis]|uniref:Uncharacterized protein n=1 Tax=Arctia plantaginis TaxID=874455 RepID=A0A8S1BDL8_ARCPL|nr:unnamed protein product [Arctia plantaginis]CAB3256472.1 unnamed protein product [Arctia plantaginis]
MNDFQSLEKTIVRELSCRMCLCTDVVKLKPLSTEVKRKIKRLFDVVIRTDDNLPKAICHDCLQQISALYLYTVKVEKTQKFLEFHKIKMDEKREVQAPSEKLHPVVGALSTQNILEEPKKPAASKVKSFSIPTEQHQQGDSKSQKLTTPKKKNASDLKYMESMTLEEFAHSEKVDKQLLSTSNVCKIVSNSKVKVPKAEEPKSEVDYSNDSLDPLVLIDGRPAKQGAALDRQITLFYKMECCICHETGFHFRSLMKHYKNRHGVPGYVTCCNKKFHYFYPKKIIEHMAFHLQQNIFMCPSCHQNFQTSQELYEHRSNGGRSEGKIICPRCAERFPTYRELGVHIVTHRVEKLQCDYCGKLLKHHHRKKTINHMEDLILCTICIRALKGIEKQEKEIKEKVKGHSNESFATHQKYQKFKQAMGLSGDDDVSTE